MNWQYLNPRSWPGMIKLFILELPLPRRRDMYTG
jgi:hypothetical protein